MKKVLDKYKVVSFDMFDTLVSRAVSNPTDVFDLVQLKYNNTHKKQIDSFKENRIQSEKEAYSNLSKGVEEITFDQIYSILEKYYSKKTCNELKELEMEIEYDVCIPNTPVINNYYDYCKSNKKRIVITSDMYLPNTLIEKILKKCGIEYDYLYLSNEIGKKKRYSLLPYVIEKESIKKSELIHIGDNLKHDYLSPIMNGIKSIRVKRKKYKNNLNKFISIFSHSNDFYYKFGYDYFGPILLGYSKYLHDNLKNEKKYFLSRDGYIMKLAYETLYGKDDNNIYMYASRRSLIVPTLWNCENYSDMFSKYTIKSKLTVIKAFNILGLDDKTISKHLSKSDYEMVIDKKELFQEDFQNKYNDLFKLVIDNSKVEYDNLCKYLKSIDFNNDSNIIDIGWNCSMQLALSQIFKFKGLDSKISGYYIGVNRKTKNNGKIDLNGYLFDDKKNSDIFYSEKTMNSLFESLFLAPHGSVIKYDKKSNPVFSEYEYNKSESEIYSKIQAGAIQFISDIKEYNLTDYLCLNEKEAYYNMKKFSYYPSLKMVEKFGDIKYVDNGVYYIAKPKALCYYLVHPKVFVQDLKTSGWLVGFMKRLTKINFGYNTKFINIFKRNERIRNNKEKSK